MAAKTFPKGAISQEKVFYTSEWTKEIDHRFIEVLVDQAASGNFVVGRKNAHAVLCAMTEVNRQFHTNFDYKFCVDRAKKLHKYYQVFNWIINLFSVKYNPHANIVQCSQDMWEFICREEMLGMAYMLSGEHEFESLKCIFQTENGSNKGPVETEIIQISSDNQNNRGQDDQSSYDTNDSFFNELVWYASDSTSETSLVEIDRSSFFSSTGGETSKKKNIRPGACTNVRSPSVEPPSSTASNSSFKRI